MLDVHCIRTLSLAMAEHPRCHMHTSDPEQCTFGLTFVDFADWTEKRKPHSQLGLKPETYPSLPNCRAITLFAIYLNGRSFRLWHCVSYKTANFSEASADASLPRMWQGSVVVMAVYLNEQILTLGSVSAALCLGQLSFLGLKDITNPE